MTPQEHLISAKAAYDHTLKKITEAVNAVKANKDFATDPTFCVIACVPGAALAQFVVAVSHKMAQMAASEMGAQQHSQGGTPDGE